MTATKLALALVAIAALQSCAAVQQVPPWLHATPDELAACQADSCSVWTPDELKELIKMVFEKGYMAGKGSL